MALCGNRDIHPSDGEVDELATDVRFTGQREDGTGLVYMNARY